MSCDWNIHCVTCGDTHGFNDANHMDKEMLVLCKHAEAIAALADLFAEPTAYIMFNLGTRGAIDPRWFRKHLGHELLPIDEYGRLYEHCNALIECEAGHQHWCGLLRKHDGPHKLVKGVSR